MTENPRFLLTVKTLFWDGWNLGCDSEENTTDICSCTIIGETQDSIFISALSTWSNCLEINGYSSLYFVSVSGWGDGGWSDEGCGDCGLEDDDLGGGDGMSECVGDTGDWDGDGDDDCADCAGDWGDCDSNGDCNWDDCDSDRGGDGDWEEGDCDGDCNEDGRGICDCEGDGDCSLDRGDGWWW